MPEIILPNYFCGDESEEFIYFKIPRLLIMDQRFRHVPTDAKLLYGMLLDHMGLLQKTTATSARKSAGRPTLSTTPEERNWRLSV